MSHKPGGIQWVLVVNGGVRKDLVSACETSPRNSRNSPVWGSNQKFRLLELI